MPETEKTKKGFFKGTVLPFGLSVATAVTSFLPSRASADSADNKTQKFEGPYVIFDTKSDSIIVDRNAVLREIQHNNAYVRGVLSDRIVLHQAVKAMTPLEFVSAHSALTKVYDRSQKAHVRAEEEETKAYIFAYTNRSNHASVQKHYLQWEAYYLNDDLRQFSAWENLCHIASRGNNGKSSYKNMVTLYAVFGKMAEMRQEKGKNGQPMTEKEFERFFREASQKTLDSRKYGNDFRKKLRDLGDRFYCPNGVSIEQIRNFRSFASVSRAYSYRLETHGARNAIRMSEIWREDCRKRGLLNSSGTASQEPSAPKEKGALKRLYDRVMDWANDRKIVKPQNGTVQSVNSKGKKQMKHMSGRGANK